MRRLATALLALSTACAATGAEARHRNGSLLHSFGAPMVISGCLGGIATAVEAGEGLPAAPVAVTGIASAVFLGVGVALLVGGSAQFVDDAPRAQGPRVRPSDGAVWDETWKVWVAPGDQRSGLEWDPKLGVWIKKKKPAEAP